MNSCNHQIGSLHRAFMRLFDSTNNNFAGTVRNDMVEAPTIVVQNYLDLLVATGTGTSGIQFLFSFRCLLT